MHKHLISLTHIGLEYATVLCLMHVVRCTIYGVHCWCTLLTYMLYEQCTTNYVRLTLYGEQCTAKGVRLECTANIVWRIILDEQFTTYTVWQTMACMTVWQTLYLELYTIYTAWQTSYDEQCTEKDIPYSWVNVYGIVYSIRILQCTLYSV